MSLADFFKGELLSRQIFEAVRLCIDAAGPSTMRVTMSQVSFGRRRRFAWLWMPRRALHGRGAPLVLTLGLPSRDSCPRWKEIVEPAPGRFTHHMELNAVSDVDDEVQALIRKAWTAAA